LKLAKVVPPHRKERKFLKSTILSQLCSLRKVDEKCLLNIMTTFAD